MAAAHRPSPLSFEGRQSPFRRQNSTSPATARATTPCQSPNKQSSNPSPTKAVSLSPEKQSPFVRRPSQISQTSERPASPLARPSNILSVPFSPARQTNNISTKSDTDDCVNVNAQPSEEPSKSFSLLTNASASPSLQSPPFLDGTSTETLPPQSRGNITTPARHNMPSSTTSTIRPNTLNGNVTRPAQPKFGGGSGGFNHVPPPLLRSMRESFEVLDSSNSGSINSASVASMLDQMGLASNATALTEFFSSGTPHQINLARYLDILSGPMADLSNNDELTAAFEAFDVDDSGQIDVAELRHALLNTAPEPGEDIVRLSERDIDSIIGEFSSRRAFGAKGVNVAKSKGEVFRYRDFMASVSGGGDDAAQAGIVT